jgi:Zn-dependent protease with chaperone function
MNFFEAQDEARRLTKRLVLLYLLAVVGIVVGIWAPFALVAGPDPVVLLLIALGVGVVIGSGAAFRTLQLRSGGGAVARLLGGRAVAPDTEDPRERVLMNVVEEMAIASGVPRPEVYILDHELGINAFAAGHTLNDAAVAITRGGLEAFTRDELQGVMAHEFSHILNGDMRLNVRLMGLLFGIFLLTVVGRGLLRAGHLSGRSRTASRKDGAGMGILAAGALLVLVGWVGVFAGRLIQAAVSRQREYLADAAAVQFTRNPQGIAGALRRIGAASQGSRLEDSHAEEASHLFFARGMGRSLSALTATHPPLHERISRIDPTWDGSFDPVPSPIRARASTSAAGSTPSRPPEAMAAALIPASGLLAAAGSLEPAGIGRARELLERLPVTLRTGLRHPEGALEAVLALLLLPRGGNAGAPNRERWVALVTARLGPVTAGGVVRRRAELEGLPPEAALPVLELALPALRGLEVARGAALRETAGELIREGGGVRPFDFAVYHLLRRNLPREAEGSWPSTRLGQTPLGALAEELQLLLSALAWAGGMGAESALAAGAARLPGIGAGLRLLPRQAVTLEAVDAALSRLEGGALEARRLTLEAAQATVAADGRLTVEEAELLRAVAESLEIPLPPPAP